MKSEIMSTKKIYGISSFVELMIALFPLVIIYFFGILFLFSATRRVIRLILTQNQLVDLLTFVFLMAGSMLGLRLILLLKKHEKGGLVFWFYLAFSIGLFFTAMEEVSWGQQFFSFESPAVLNDTNRMEEMTIKNVRIWQNHLELFPLTIGLVGILGVWASKISGLRNIHVPYLLLPWFLVIALISAIDLFHDFYIVLAKLDGLVNNLEEITELLIGISGFLFIWLNMKRLSF